MLSPKLPASQLVTPLFFIHALNFIQRHIYVCHIHIYTHTLFGEHIDIDITFRIVGPRPPLSEMIHISIYHLTLGWPGTHYFKGDINIDIFPKK